MEAAAAAAGITRMCNILGQFWPTDHVRFNFLTFIEVVFTYHFEPYGTCI